MSKQWLLKNATQAMATIKNLILPEMVKLKLKTIANKIFQSVQLSQAENSFWKSFSNNEKAYILTGDPQESLDFTKYQSAGYIVEENFNQGVPNNLQHQEPN